MGYSKDTIKGLSWMGTLRASTRVIAFARIAILARILSPAQFGLYGIATLVMAFLEMLTETGINVFFIQKEGELKDYINTAWIISIIRGAFIALVIVVLSPFIATFFNAPESRNLLLLVSTIPLLRGFINPAIVKYQKDLEFKKEFYLRFSLFLVDSTTAIVLGLITRQADSMIYGLMAGAFFEVLLSFWLIKPRPKISFDFEQVKHIVSRGKWVTAYGVFNYSFENGDDIVVGKLLSAPLLGVYQMAYKISSLPITEVAEVFIKVTFPVYSKIAEDRQRLKSAFVKTTLAVGALVLPFGLGIYIFSSELVNILLGSQWGSAVPVLKILAFFGVVRAFTHPAYAVLLALKRQDLVMYATLFSLAVMLIAIVPAIGTYGILGAGYAVLTASLLTAPFVFWQVKRVLYT